jgi:capsule polysaccharide export protein KpsE/RkpR
VCLRWAEFKQSIEDMEKQKRKADEILKRYREKHGAIDPDSQPAAT